LKKRVAVWYGRWQWVPSQRCGSAERSSAKWCPSKWHAQQWDGRRSSVTCAGAHATLDSRLMWFFIELHSSNCDRSISDISVNTWSCMAPN